jgi:hypothetical protein
MSRHVSLSCSSECMVPVCQSYVATWPVLPTIAVCLDANFSVSCPRTLKKLHARKSCCQCLRACTDLPLRVYLRRYGPPSSTISFRPRAASEPTTLTISSWLIRHVRSISLSTSIFPASVMDVSISASLFISFARAAWLACRSSRVRSLGFAIWVCFREPGGGFPCARRDFGVEVRVDAIRFSILVVEREVSALPKI